MSTSLPRDWEALYRQVLSDFAHEVRKNKKLKVDIRSLHRKLVDANRGAETNAHALYHASGRFHEEAMAARKLRTALMCIRPFVLEEYSEDCATPEFKLAIKLCNDALK